MKKKLLVLTASTLLAGMLTAQTAYVSGSVISQFGTDLDTNTSGFNVGLDDVDIKVQTSVDSSNAEVLGSGDSAFYGEVKITGIALEASTEQDWERSTMTVQANYDVDGDGDVDTDDTIEVPILIHSPGLQDEETFSYNSNDWDWTPGSEVEMRLVWGDILANLYLGPVTVKLFANSGKSEIKKGGVDVWGEINKNAYDYSIYTGQYGSTDISLSEGLAWSNDENEYFMGVNNDYATVSWITSADTFYDTYEGVQATYSVEDVADITLGVSSRGDWTANTESEYTVKGSANLTAVDNLTFVLEGARAINRVNQGDQSAIWRTDLDTEIGLKMAYNLMIGDNVSISPVLGADIGMLDDYEEDALVDTASNLEAIMWSGTAGAKVNAFGSTLTAYYSMNGREENPDSAYTVSASVSAIENVTFQAAYEATHLYKMDEVYWSGDRYVDTTGVHGKLTVDLPIDEKITVTPSAEMSMCKTEVDGADVDFAYYAKAGVEVNGLVENTTFSLDWDSNELTADDNLGKLVFTTRLAF